MRWQCGGHRTPATGPFEGRETLTPQVRGVSRVSRPGRTHERDVAVSRPTSRLLARGVRDAVRARKTCRAVASARSGGVELSGLHARGVSSCRVCTIRARGQKRQLAECWGRRAPYGVKELTRPVRQIFQGLTGGGRVWRTDAARRASGLRRSATPGRRPLAADTTGRRRRDRSVRTRQVGADATGRRAGQSAGLAGAASTTREVSLRSTPDRPSARAPVTSDAAMRAAVS